MIKENQKLFNRLNVLSDGLILLLALPVAFWLRFYVLPGGVITVPLEEYLLPDGLLMLVNLLLFALLGLYDSHRRSRLYRELLKLWLSGGVVMLALFALLFISREINYSRVTLGIYYLLGFGLISCKRTAMRLALRRLRREGYNLKHILIVGKGKMAGEYLAEIAARPELGYSALGYVADGEGELGLKHLGGYAGLESLLEKHGPDEVVCALDASDDHMMPQVIAACEKCGIKLNIVPFYAEYMSSSVQMDELGGVPLLNIRRVPLDNWGNAFIKRTMDIIGSAALIVLSSPIMLVCAIGVKLSSPGPVIFRQERVGRGNKRFYMYKFRSMCLNDSQDTGWSTDSDSRKTPFGAFIRKFSLDEFPQFFNVLKGDMSLIGPRPELPHFVERFRDEIPLYMVKHQVRPGITGWAQVNDLRGDTSIKERIEHDIYYIEHWSLLLDIKILFITVFGGKFKNSENLK